VKTDKDYPRYGGRGVSVCPEWLIYENFVDDMGEPNGDETLDRIDVYGNYTKENCRWAGVKTQNRNVRVRSSSKTGYVGVSIVGKKFMAKVTVGKKAYYSKLFPTVEEAAAARKELERLHWSAA
jgi:2'-5' RNA ligase